MNIVNDIYKTVHDINLPVRIYYSDDNKHNEDIVICIHGGGWHAVKTNDPWNGGWMNYQAQYYAEKGYVGAVFSYRSIDITEETDVFDLYYDCVDAVKYILSHVNCKRVIIMGDSAGAHLALMLAFGDDVKADIVVACNPVLDLTESSWNYTTGDEETRKKASPYFAPKLVDTKFLFMHGDSDTVVDYRKTAEFSDKLNDMGMMSTFYKLNGIGHAFILKGYKSTDEQVDEYMKITDSFIESNQ